MADTPHFHGHRQRLKERLARDAGGLADYEVLELLLAHVLPRRDTKPLAKELLARFATLRGVLDAPPEELEGIKGFGPGAAAFWLLLAEVRARYEEARVAERAVLDGPRALVAMARARLGHKREEELWAALTDNGNRLLAWDRLHAGAMDRVALDVQAVLRHALLHRARNILLVHNHPGGSARPSPQDRKMTEDVGRAAFSVGLSLIEHIIITEDEYYSFQEAGDL